MSVEVLAYTPDFDRTEVGEISLLSSEQQSEKRKEFESYVNQQLITLLAERFNVLSSVYDYEIIDGQLWGRDMGEPALNSFKRGRDARKRYGNPVDGDREDAEIVGFSKIQDIMTDENSPNGTMLLSISPQGKEGSTYQHNFYDVFTKKKGKVETRRYSSGLALDDYRERLGIDSEISDVSFLRNPIEITPFFENPDEVHGYLHKTHDFMIREEFDRVIVAGTSSTRKGYIRALFDDGKSMQHLQLNAMLNVSDELVDGGKQGEDVSCLDLSPEQLIRYGMAPVKEVTAGCGLSGGFDVGKGEFNNPFSVSEFGDKKNWKFDQEGECQMCNTESKSLGPCKVCKPCNDKIDAHEALTTEL